MLVSKGIRINEDNLTIDLEPEVAAKLRAAMLKSINALPPQDQLLLVTFCDMLAGPLPRKPDSTNWIEP